MKKSKIPIIIVLSIIKMIGCLKTRRFYENIIV